MGRIVLKNLKEALLLILIAISFSASIQTALSKTSESADDDSRQFFVYATASCGECQKQLDLLKQIFGNSSVIFFDISNGTNREYYTRITSLVVEAEAIDASDSARGLIPLSGYFKNDKMQAVVFGPLSDQDWQSIDESQKDESIVHCFVGSIGSNVTISGQRTITSLAELFSQTASLNEYASDENWATLLPLISLAAAVDAVNPCELNAFLILLVYIFYNVGKKDVLKVGLAFTLAVFISYYLMGVGLLRILQEIPSLRFVAVAFAVAVGAFEILSFFGLKRKHVPDSFATRIRESLKRAVNPYTAFLAGIAVSFLILPCTSGSYFVALDLLATNTTFTSGLFLLTLYNAIVVFPFVVITLVIYTLTVRTSKLRVWMNEKEKWLRLFGGVTMIVISVLFLI